MQVILSSRREIKSEKGCQTLRTGAATALTTWDPCSKKRVIKFISVNDIRSHDLKGLCVMAQIIWVFMCESVLMSSWLTTMEIKIAHRSASPGEYNSNSCTLLFTLRCRKKQQQFSYSELNIFWVGNATTSFRLFQGDVVWLLNILIAFMLLWVCLLNKWFI